MTTKEILPEEVRRDLGTIGHVLKGPSGQLGVYVEMKVYLRCLEALEHLEFLMADMQKRGASVESMEQFRSLRAGAELQQV
jgi:hypothetical protein